MPKADRLLSIDYHMYIAFIIIIMFTSLVLEGVRKSLSLYMRCLPIAKGTYK